MSTLSVEQTASLLHCSEEHVRRLARNKTLPGIKVGRDWIFLEENLLDWLREKSAPAKRGRPRREIPLI